MIGLYLHVPYCTVRCSYCDFYLVPARGRDLDAYVAALEREIDVAGARARRPPADSLHFGGGTPSRLGSGRLGRIVGALRAAFEVAPDAEVALEANPEDLSADGAAALVEGGFRRVAIGVQSFDDGQLRRMRRPHDVACAVASIGAARRAGFASVAADLILGLPGQPAADALRDVGRLADLGVDHVSLYLLEIHERTRLGREVALGRTTLPDADEVAGLYEAAADDLDRRGFEHYEISNFARPGHRSRHNLKYWTDGDYLGFGPAAHSRVGMERWSNAADLDSYLRTGGAPDVEKDAQPRAVRGLEALVTGLRLAEGVDLGVLAARYGDAIPPPGAALLADLASLGLVVVDGTRLRLTRRGRLVSNEIFERLMPPADPSQVAPGTAARQLM